MKTFFLCAAIIGATMLAPAADNGSRYTRFYIITGDTIASLEIPTGYRSVTPVGPGNPIGRITYSDSCYFLYSDAQPAGVQLLSGPDFIQTGTDTVDEMVGWRSGGSGSTMQRIERYGRLREHPHHYWHEDNIGMNGLSPIHFAFVSSAPWQRNRFFHALRCLERYASGRASVKFLEATRYLPEKGRVAGAYSRGDGFSYDKLELKDDGSFILQGGGDILVDGCPDPGYRGHYTVNADTLRLRVEGFIIPQSSSKKWKKELRKSEPQMVKNFNDPQDYDLFKKLGDYVFLVSSSGLFEFAQDAIVHGGLPEFCPGGRDYAAHWLTKLQ